MGFHSELEIAFIIQNVFHKIRIFALIYLNDRTTRTGLLPPTPIG